MAISARMKRMNNCIAVDLDRGPGFNGQIYNCYQDKPLSFHDVSEFIDTVNAFLDKVEYPGQKHQFRNFKKVEKPVMELDFDKEVKLCETEDIAEKVSDIGFVVMILGRDNATWQGKVYDKAREKEFSFTSELELFRCLNN